MCEWNDKAKRRARRLPLTRLLCCASLLSALLLNVVHRGAVVAADPPVQTASSVQTEQLVREFQTTQPIVIRLRPVTSVLQHDVTLGQVAEILTSSQDQQKFRYLSELDLIQIPDGQRLQLLEKSLIDVRLQLHGLHRSQYRLLGPDDVILSLQPSSGAQSNGADTDAGHDDRSGISMQRQPSKREARITPVSLHDRRPEMLRQPPQPAVELTSETLTDLLVESSVQSALERQFALQPGDVRAQLLRPFVDDTLQKAVFEKQMRLEVVSPPELPLGRTNMLVRLWDGSQLLTSRSAFVDVRRRRYVLICRKTIAQGSAVNADDVNQEVRFVDSEQDELQAADVAKRTARRSIRPGEILSSRDFINELVAQSGKPIIRARDSVRVTAYRKGLKFVVPAAEALQSGHTGQLIRVRNVHSNRILTGRVVAEGEVEVQLQ